MVNLPSLPSVGFGVFLTIIAVYHLEFFQEFSRSNSQLNACKSLAISSQTRRLPLQVRGLLLAIQTENNICMKKKQPRKTKHVSRFSQKREHGRSDG